MVLLEEAERHLGAGHSAAALETLERAAMMRHAADTEATIVRAMMAAGQYRRALAACAHTAGAHREQSGGAALYAWLLHIGGQEVVARRMLQEALQRAPSDTLLLHARSQLASDWPLAGDLLGQAPWRAAPLAFAAMTTPAPAAPARVVGTAVLLSNGTQALSMPMPAMSRAEPRMWLRNGLGHTVRVVARRPLAEWPLELLTLAEALPVPGWEGAIREPFAGSPGCMVEYAPDERGRAAWPLLRQGFFAGIPGALPSRPLGLAAPSGPRGGPVFDAAGRLAGIAVGGDRDRLIGLQPLRALLDGSLPERAAQAAPASAAAAPQPVGPEVAYEFSLRGALQVLLDDHRG